MNRMSGAPRRRPVLCLDSSQAPGQVEGTADAPEFRRDLPLRAVFGWLKRAAVGNFRKNALARIAGAQHKRDLLVRQRLRDRRGRDDQAGNEKEQKQAHASSCEAEDAPAVAAGISDAVGLSILGHLNAA